jgi:hypothetical protein
MPATVFVIATWCIAFVIVALALKPRRTTRRMLHDLRRDVSRCTALMTKYQPFGPKKGLRYAMAPDCGGMMDYRIRDYTTGKDVHVRYLYFDALEDCEKLNRGEHVDCEPPTWKGSIYNYGAFESEK